MATMKTLHISPVDVGLDPLGMTSPVADVEVSVTPDRDVAFSDGTFMAGGCPLVETSIPMDGLDVQVPANDDASIVIGDGFTLVVELRYRPRRGSHRKPVHVQRRMLIDSAEQDVVPFGQAKPLVQVPYYMRPSEYVAFLEKTVLSLRAQLDTATATIAERDSTVAALQARNASQAATITGLQQQAATAKQIADQRAATQAVTIRDLQAQVAYLKAHGGTPMPQPTRPPVVVTDLGDGTSSISGTGVIDNGDGTLTLTGANVSESAGIVTIS